MRFTRSYCITSITCNKKRIIIQEKEIWKDIKGYEGSYKVSNLGRIRSLERIVLRKDGKLQKVKEIVLTNILGDYYYQVTLHNKGIKKVKRVHILVAIAFKNHKPEGFKLVVNHKDFDMLNNNANNLEVVTQRKNTDQQHLNNTSKYIGVHWNKHGKRWRSSVRHGKKQIHLGYFINEIDASKAYEDYKLKHNLQ